MVRFVHLIRINIAVCFFLAAVCVSQQSSPQPATKLSPVEGDYLSRDFHFKSGETLAELRLHYMTLGKPERDAKGKVTNAVLILHGTGGSGRQFLAPQFALKMVFRPKTYQ
jgi:homoserine O-acetyltransferase/O-succinyltransferase